MTSKSLSTMNKAELVAVLKEFGEEPHPKWTSIEIRSRLKELRPHTSSKGQITASSSKKEIVDFCLARGIPVTPNDTKGYLLKKGRSMVDMTELNPTTLMGFGKYASLTYQEVKEQFPSYVVWALETVSEGDAAVKLQRFVAWIKKSEETESGDSRLPTPGASSGGPMAGVSHTPEGSRKVKRGLAAAPEPTSPKDVEAQMQEMMTTMRGMMTVVSGAVEDLNERVRTMESHEERIRNMEAARSSVAPSTTGSFVEVTVPSDNDVL